MKQKILIAPLDWGLGHATRCVPLIQQQLALGNEVLLAATGASAAFLKNYFPVLQMLENIPAYNVSYPQSGNMAWAMLLQSPKIVAAIHAEKKWLEEVIPAHRIDDVISDNRYGLHSQKIKTTFITHQLFIQAPLLAKPLLNAWVRRYASLFHQCLVPDYEGDNNLSGALSHGTTPLQNIRYIGPLSRLQQNETDEPAAKKYFALAILSGPEPQRTVLQQIITEVFLQWKKPCAILCGQPHQQKNHSLETIDFFSHANDHDLVQLVNQSEHIICRSGYSTIMDLHALKRSAVLIPTPGQTEQIYLAHYHAEKKNHRSLLQHHLNASTLAELLQGL